ncbi:hypothetical protein [Pedobacter nutrimenti]|uniref:hypothetical protein n=1 Tax=Pedobacter nutrimenti TaxID=1241337 RepID=UPI00292D3079|nr:hypothetical protein [Pedobacter nutrimenti]
MKLKLLTLSAALVMLFGCTKDGSIEQNATASLKKSVANTSAIKAKALLLDSLTQLRTDYSLESAGNVQVAPEDTVVRKFKTVAEARAFLENMTNSKLESYTPPAGASASNPILQSNPLLSKNNMSTFNFGSQRHFYQYLPFLRFRWGSFNFNWPTGFYISGDIKIEDTVQQGSGFTWGHFSSYNAEAEMYGLTFSMSYESKGVSFSQQSLGSQATINFYGTVVFLIFVNDIGELYRKPISGRMVMRFGPYPQYTYPSGENSFDKVLFYSF